MNKNVALAVVFGLLLGATGMFLFYKPSFKKPTDDTVMTAKFTLKEYNDYSHTINRSMNTLALDSSRVHRKNAIDSFVIVTNWMSGVIDSIYRK